VTAKTNKDNENDNFTYNRRRGRVPCDLGAPEEARHSASGEHDAGAGLGPASPGRGEQGRIPLLPQAVRRQDRGPDRLQAVRHLPHPHRRHKGGRLPGAPEDGFFPDQPGGRRHGRAAVDLVPQERQEMTPKIFFAVPGISRIFA